MRLKFILPTSSETHTDINERPMKLEQDFFYGHPA